MLTTLPLHLVKTWKHWEPIRSMKIKAMETQNESFMQVTRGYANPVSRPLCPPRRSVSHRRLQPEGRVACPGSECGWTCILQTAGKMANNVVTALTCNEEIKEFPSDFQQVLNVCYVWVDSQQSVCLGEKLLLQGDDNDLHVLPGLLPDETGHLDANRKHPTQDMQKCRNAIHENKVIGQ